MLLSIPAMVNRHSQRLFRSDLRSVLPVRAEATSATNAKSASAPPTSSVALAEAPTWLPSGPPVELISTPVANGEQRRNCGHSSSHGR
jgi:hypothetical protein